MKRLEGKVAAVTGGASGIGRGIALSFAREGAAVAIGDIDEAGASAVATEIAEKAGARTLGLKCDVVSRAEVEALVAASVEKFGRFDIMVANAGIGIGVRALETPEDVWDRTMDINARGVMFSDQAAARQIIAEKHGGSIINIASIAALNGVSAQLMAYCASKAAVAQLSRCFALDLAGDDIRVNAIAPGLVDTPIWGKLFNDPDFLERGVRDQFAAGVPLGRMATPEDIADMAVFLASAESRYVTGQVLVVDGGRTVGLPAAMR